MWFEKWQTWIERMMAYASSIMVGFTMVLVTIDVLGRYVFNTPLPGTYELSEVLLAAIIFLALPYVQYEKAHIAITMFYDHYPPRTKEIFDIVCMIAGTVVFGLIAAQGIELTLNSWAMGEVSEGAVHFFITPFKMMVAFGFGFLSLRTLTQLIAATKAMRAQGKGV